MARIRRERDDGALFFNATKDRWVGQLDLGRDLTGKRLRPTVTGRTTTFGDLARQWFDRGLPPETSAKRTSRPWPPADTPRARCGSC